jgi:hypothetical protein
VTDIKNDFTIWRERMGFGVKQTGHAASLIGYRARSATAMATGKRRPDRTDRLAMSAVRAGLEPWTPQNDKEAFMLQGVVAAYRAAPR